MNYNENLKIDIQSEIGKLNAVLLHRPGAEVENMTPRNVQRALYSDILTCQLHNQSTNSFLEYCQRFAGYTRSRTF